MRDTTFVRVDPAVPCSVKDAEGFARLVQDLIALATHRAAGVIWLRLKLSEGTSDASPARAPWGRNVALLLIQRPLAPRQGPSTQPSLRLS